MSHALLSHSLQKLCPALTAFFASSSLPAFSQVCYTLVDAQRPELSALLQTAPPQAPWQHNHKYFLPSVCSQCLTIIYFFTVPANWDGVSMEVWIVRSHLCKAMATDLETHHWTGKTRIAFSLMHYFTFTYIKYLLFTRLLYLVRSFFNHEEALVLTTLNNLLSSVYLVTSLFTRFSISLMNMLNSTGQYTDPAGFHSWLLSTFHS